MNELARGLLVQAALNGTKQIRGALFHHDGRCAMGVIIEGCGLREAWHKARFDNRDYARFWDTVYEQAEITENEHDRIMQMNDKEGLDFLSIARKLGGE